MPHTVNLLGKVSRDPTMNETPSGKSVCNLTLEVQDRRGPRGTLTTRFRVAAWGNMGQFVMGNVTEGTHLWVRGKLDPDSSGYPRVWEGKDGRYISAYEVFAEEIAIV